VKGQGHDTTIYGQKRHFGNFEGHGFKCQHLGQSFRWMHTGQWVAINDHVPGGDIDVTPHVTFVDIS